MKTRNFRQIEKKYKPIEFLAGPRGSLYYVKPGWFKKEMLIRRFDGDIPPELVPAFADLTRACAEWIESRPELAALARVEPLIEVGEDFVSRKYFVGNTLAQYHDTTEVIPNPPELKRMVRAFKKVRGKSNHRRDLIIEEVLERSLLEPTGKTVFVRSAANKFVIIEPRFTAEHLREWNELEI